MIENVPSRIRLYASAGWRLPGNAVSLALPNRWANPYVVAARFPEVQSLPELARAVRDRKLLTLRAFMSALLERTTPTDCLGPAQLPITPHDVKHHLSGKDLACWCKLCPAHTLGRPVGSHCDTCDPCHGDFLLLVANVHS